MTVAVARRFVEAVTAHDFEEVGGEVVARTRETARRRDTGEVAYDGERIVVLPGGAN